VSRLVVLNTRPAEQAAELTQLLLGANFEVVEAPAIAIVPAWDALTLDQTRRDLLGGAFAWIVIASQNAGRGLEEELRGHTRRVLCGAATAAVLGLDHARTLERFSAAAALGALRPVLRRGQRVLVPRAAEGREELVDGLRGLGVDVHAPVAYRTVPASVAAERLRQQSVDVLTLCSPSAVDSVCSAVPPETRVVCLGRTTADTARVRGLHVDRIADKPTMAALVTAIQTIQAVHV
jgi:uroporphyrinogen-III synthase